MRKGGGGFGMIMMLVVVAIVLYLAARAWSNMAPEALSVSNVALDPSDLVSDDGDSGESPTPGHLPNLQEMRESVAQHEDQVRDAMEETN